MAKSTIALTKQQKSLFQQMSPPMKNMAAKMKRAADKIITDEVLGNYDLGVHAADVTKNERRYGQKAIPVLAAFLGYKPNILWNCRKFANAYSRSEVEKMLKRVCPANRRIHYTHFVHLSGLAGTKALAVRNRLETEIMEQGLTTVELARKCKEALGPRASSKGRPIRVPGSLLKGIIDMEETTSKLVKRVDIWDESIFDRVDRGEELSTKSVQQLEHSKKVMVAAAAKITAVTARIDEAITTAKQKLAAAKAEAKKPKPVGRLAKKKAASKKAAKKTVVKKKAAKKKVAPKKKKAAPKSPTGRIQAARRRRKAG